VGEIHIERIPVGRLPEFAQQAVADPERYRILPITTYRATAHATNPVASPDDIGLIVAYDDDRCIGYLGLLPCQLRAGEKITTIYALSTFYIDPAFRGRQVADNIMAAAIQLDYGLLLSGFTPAAEKYYRKNPHWFTYAGAVPYMRLRLDRLFVVSGVFRKLAQVRALGPFRWLFNALFSLSRRTVDPVLRPLMCRFFCARAVQRSPKVEARPVVEVQKIDSAKSHLDESGRPHFYRDEKIVNWMIKYPWITEEPNVRLDYQFSYRRDRFSFLPFELFDRQSGERVGYVVFSISTEGDYSTLKILDYRITEEIYAPGIFELAMHEASRRMAEVIGPYRFWFYAQTNRRLRRHTERRERGTFIGPAGKKESVFAGVDDELMLDFCDGDTPFT